MEMIQVDFYWGYEKAVSTLKSAIGYGTLWDGELSKYLAFAEPYESFLRHRN